MVLKTSSAARALYARRNGALVRIDANAPITNNPQPPVSTRTPTSILNIGGGTGQNSYKVQVAPRAANGTSTFVEHTRAEIMAGYSEDPVFKSNSAGTAVQFYARADAATTSGTQFARSELREMQANGTTNAAWDALTGTHEMHGFSRIMHLPAADPEVVVAQVHNGDADRIAIRTQVFTTSPGVPQLVVRINGTVGSPPKVFTTRYVYGTEFEWKIRIVNGAISIFFNDMNTPKFTAPAGTLTSTGSPSWYFKAGAYNQFNETNVPADEYSLVELRGLTTYHAASSTTSPVSATAMPVGNLPGWTQTLAENFTTPAPLGTFADVYPSWRGYDFGFDTSNNPGFGRPAGKSGMYNTWATTSVTNGILKIHCFTSDGSIPDTTAGRPLVAAPMPGGYQTQTYGRYSYRMRSTNVNGDGYKVAWLLWPAEPNGWNSGEIDYPEGALGTNNVQGFSHQVDGNPAINEFIVNTNADMDTWHVYTIEWKPDSLEFFIDGVSVGRTTNARAIPHVPMFWVLQTETWLSATPPPESSTADVECDWVVKYAYTP